jgi:phage terminase large subunit-like protein
MSSMTIVLPRLHAAQWEVAASPARFKVLDAGRRFGKTLLGTGLGTKKALEGGRAWWVAPSYKVAAVGWRGAKHIASQIPGVARNETERLLTFPGGGTLQVRSGDDPNSLRGDGLDLAVLDEAAYMRPEVWSEAIRPALSDRQGEALFISTPNGRNWFWGLWMYGQNPAYSDWASWRFPTSSNPYIKPEEIEAARELLPERIFKQEYLAEFLEDEGAVFRRVEERATVAEPESGPLPGERIVFGVDWGRDNDFTCIAILSASRRRLVALDRFNEIGWNLQRGRLVTLAQHWQPEVIWAEANSIGGPNIEALQMEGLPVQPFTTTASSKGPLIESLALAFEKGEIAILNDPVLVGELLAYSMERLPSGRWIYSAPAGLHDDTVIALALAWHGAIYGGVGISFV